jgi:hypothetical protein
MPATIFFCSGVNNPKLAYFCTDNFNSLSKSKNRPRQNRINTTITNPIGFLSAFLESDFYLSTLFAARGSAFYKSIATFFIAPFHFLHSANLTSIF